MKVETVNSQEFIITHSNGIKQMTATCLMVCRKRNIMRWQFKHSNGMMKYFDMFDHGLEFYEEKGW